MKLNKGFKNITYVNLSIREWFDDLCLKISEEFVKQFKQVSEEIVQFDLLQFNFYCFPAKRTHGLILVEILSRKKWIYIMRSKLMENWRSYTKIKK